MVLSSPRADVNLEPVELSKKRPRQPLPAILSLDPGGTTGWAYRGKIANEQKLVIGQLGESSQEHHLELEKLLTKYHAHASANDQRFVIVCERFQWRKEDSARGKIELISKEYEGVISLYGKKNDVLVIKQNPAQAVGRTAFWGDSPEGNSRMKLAKMYKAGRYVHANDALRHMLYYISFTLKDGRYLAKLESLRDEL